LVPGNLETSERNPESLNPLNPETSISENLKTINRLTQLILVICTDVFQGAIYERLGTGKFLNQSISIRQTITSIPMQPRNDTRMRIREKLISR
jgi:hypothetical protein